MAMPTVKEALINPMMAAEDQLLIFEGASAGRYP